MSNDQKNNNNIQAAPAGSSAGLAPFDDRPAEAVGGAAAPIPFADFGAISNSKAIVPSTLPSAPTLNSMLDVPVPIVFEVGRTEISIAHLMELCEGSYIDLRSVSVDVIDVLVNEEVVAEAEAISLQQRYGIRISEVTRIPCGEDSGNAS